MELSSALAGKILLGGSVAVVGTGGFVLFTQYPELIWKKSWTDNFELPRTCKTIFPLCQLDSTQLGKLRFLNGTHELKTPHVSKPTANEKVTLIWRKTNSENDFPYQVLLSIITGSEGLEIKKANNTDDGKISIPANSTAEFKLKLHSDSYYLQHIPQSEKETSANIQCSSDTSCTNTAGKEISGLEGLASVTLTKSSNADSLRYSGAIKYKISSQSEDKNGDYSLDFSPEESKWKLSKVTSNFSKWDKAVLSLKTWTASTEATTPKKITVKVTNTAPSFAWECEINPSDSSSKTFDLSSQLTTLKTNLGIKADTSSKITLEELQKRRRFVEKCANKREDSKKTIAEKNTLGESEKIESVITLSVEKIEPSAQGGGEKYKFSDEKFKKLFTEEALD